MKVSNAVVLSLGVLFFTTVVTGLNLNSIKQPKNGKLWALLVAGSNGYDNYRHQADVCHAYHVLHNHGIPDEQIVVMMYDDIAYNEENPTPGVVINHPNGKDVYNGVPKDYVNDTVTPSNFLKILQGNKQAMKGIGSGKVINSGPNDHVFVNFADHGAVGLVAFPIGELYAKNLNKALQNMYDKKKFAKLVFYMEACESGSMFKNLLPKDINIFATTAANDKESSYACYFDEKRETYLGDVYSVKWMEDSDVENLGKESLSKQFHIVKAETNTSHVQEFGDLSIGKMSVAQFQGTKKSTKIVKLPQVPLEAVPSQDVPVHILMRKLQRTNDIEEVRHLKQKLKKLHKNRAMLSAVIKNIVLEATSTTEEAGKMLSERRDLTDFDCHEEVTQYFSKKCFSLSKNSFALRFMYIFANMCELGISSASQRAAMDTVCNHPPMHGIV